MKVLGKSELSDEYDVVVVGSGAGGLVAALTAAVGGLSVLVLEKAPQVGGTSAVSAGTIWIPVNPDMAANGLPDDADAVRDYLAATVGTGEVIDAFVDKAAATVAFLREHTGLDLVPSMSYPDYQQSAPGAMPGGRAMQPGVYDSRRLGQHAELLRRDTTVLPYSMIEFKQWGSWNNFPWDMLRERQEQGIVARGAALVGPILEACLALGVVVAVDAAADELVGDTRAVRGVRTGRREITARRGVVLASGGFEWNQQMMEEFLEVPIPVRCSPPFNTGDGHRMAEAVGARLAGMDQAWWAPMAAVPGQTVDGAQVGRHLRAERQAPGVIIVDDAGERIVNESQDYNSLIRSALAAARAKSRPLRMFVVFDHRFFERYGFLTYQAGDDLPEWVSTADTLEELADRLGIDAPTLGSTVARFNGFAVDGRDEDFHRGENRYDLYGGDPLNPYPNKTLAPLEVGPFHGMEILPGAFGTAGGVVTDAAARAIGVGGDIIDGLYAIGNVSAQPLAQGYPGAGSTLGPAMTLGHLAGADLVGRPSRVTESVTRA